MTYFQPEQKSFINYIIGAMIFASLLLSFWVVSAYNRSVNIGHEISAVELDIRKIQTEKAELQNKIFAVLSDSNLREVSKEKNLVEERNPKYFKIGAQESGDLAASRP